jgi:WD40 repeat protein
VVRVWDLNATPRQSRRIDTSQIYYDIYAMAFDPHDSMLALGTGDSKIYFYELEASRFRGEPAVHTVKPGSVNDIRLLAYSPDGRLFVSVDRGGKLILWDTSVYLPVAEMETPFEVGWFSSLRFSEDSTRLFIRQQDGDPEANDVPLSELEWIVSPDAWAEIICERAGRNLTRSEWDQYVQGETYHASCGG